MGKHVIDKVTYDTDTLVCICGFICEAIDLTAYQKHRKTAPPTDKIYVKPRTIYNRTVSVLRSSISGRTSRS